MYVVWPVWLNGTAFARNPKGCRFKSRPVRFQVTALGKLLTCMCLCPKQYNLVATDGRWRSSAGKVTTGLAESNGSLRPGGWLQVTCRLTACTQGSALGSMLGNKYGRTLPFYCVCCSMFGWQWWCNSATSKLHNWYNLMGKYLS